MYPQYPKGEECHSYVLKDTLLFVLNIFQLGCHCHRIIRHSDSSFPICLLQISYSSLNLNFLSSQSLSGGGTLLNLYSSHGEVTSYGWSPCHHFIYSYLFSCILFKTGGIRNAGSIVGLGMLWINTALNLIEKQKEVLWVALYPFIWIPNIQFCLWKPLRAEVMFSLK